MLQSVLGFRELIGGIMRFDALRYLAREDASGRIEPDAARALALPMPEDVLEQFVIDHGLKPAFQVEYSELDLASLEWVQEDLDLATIASCTSKFGDYLREIQAGPFDMLVGRTQDEQKQWHTAGSWLRSPVFVVDVGRPGLHLVEGHTRVGLLLGLRDVGFRVNNKHKCWVGRVSLRPFSADWISAIQSHPVSFRCWLYDGLGDEEDPRDVVAEELSDIESSMRYTRSFGSALKDQLELASFGSDPAQLQAQLHGLAVCFKQELDGATRRHGPSQGGVGKLPREA
jgi:hypothetical protein